MTLFAFLVTFLIQQSQVGSIEGTVVQIATTQPIARALVQVTGSQPQPITMETGADGKFQFPRLPRGQYQIKVTRTGYMDGVFGQRGPNGRGRSVSVEAGQALKDLRVTMVPLGVIAGRVYDDRGEPVANANVQALKYSYEQGQVSLKAVKSALTNDRGEYRLFWLPPGEYYVSVNFMLQFVLREAPTHPVALGGPMTPGPKPNETYAPVYYPGTADARTATAVEVRAGADLGGVDFTLVRVIPRKVRVVVIDGATGQPVRNASVMLLPRNGPITGPAPGRLSDDRFEVVDVYPGSYFLVVTTRSRGGGRITGGSTPVEVGNSDVENVTVVLSPGIDVQATMEGLLSGPPNVLYPLIGLRDEAFPGRSATAAYPSFNKGGEFTFENVVPGDYRLEISELPNGNYVKSARFGSVDALNETLHVDARTTDRLAIVLGSDGGSLEGSVVDRSKNAAANASIVLIPVNTQRLRPDLNKKATADESGRFQLREIAPGDYVVFAWEDVDDSVWRDPEFARRNEAAGRRVRIGSNSRETVELTAIPFAF